MNKQLILDGRKVADELYSKLPNMQGKELAIITIGEDEASKVYVRNKIKACEKVGLIGRNYKFNPDDYTSIEDLSYTIRVCINNLNHDNNVVGIMIQQPYLKGLKQYYLEDAIEPYKDVDGICQSNLGSLFRGDEPFHYPATPKGILTLLDYYKIPIEGKNVVIIGRSDIVGKPLAAMMLARNANPIICHSKTPKIKLIEHTRNADIIISAVGKPKFLDSTYITTTYPDHDGYPHKLSLHFPVIIDVGMNRDENGKLCGDVDFDDVLPYVSAITPVPGGVGPMTVYSLIENCCKNV